MNLREPAQTEKVICSNCRTEIAFALLSCPVCHVLVHSDRLKQFALQAERYKANDDLSGEMNAWREALLLLPPQSNQYSVISDRLKLLSQRAEGVAPDEKRKAQEKEHQKFSKSWFAALGVVGLLLWKFKALLFIVLTKGKLILLGLTKGSTFFSMFLSLGLYWKIWGFELALGIILCIYLHEMGHVMSLSRYGIKATAPMFIPGFGALIRSKLYPSSVHENAMVGLAGPIWGVIASGIALVLYWMTQNPFLGVIAKINAWINLMNLIPVWQLDGDHAFKALSRSQRWWMCAFLLLVSLVSGEMLVIVLIIFAGFHAFQHQGVLDQNRKIFVYYILLALILSFLSQMHIEITQKPS